MPFISTCSITSNRDFYGVLERYGKLGIADIELGSAHQYIGGLSRLFRFQKEHSANFVIHAFFPPLKKPFFVNFSSQDEAVRKKSIAIAKNAVDLCRKLDAKLHTTHSGFWCDVGKGGKPLSAKCTKEQAEQALQESLIEVCDYAQRAEVEIAIETMLEHSYFYHADAFIPLLKSLKLKNLSVLLDTGHLKASCTRHHLDFKEQLRKLKPHIKAMHLQENSGKGIDEHLPITNTEMLERLGKPFLQKIAITLEGQNNWTAEQILKGKQIVDEYLQ
ncbi:sugar phosphate isomerase/epimerase [Candidatus Woesearchaeota archaeon]|nr:sugar phosphate isomerase/epimerase [Candidatus Woesearchaeota archaeon]